jgi:hypothetical protein
MLQCREIIPRKLMHKNFSLIIVVALIVISSSVKPDVLIIDRIKSQPSIEVPAKGLSMQQVINKFGEPETKYEAVGQPPIIKWLYKKFTVYFEKRWVINSVIHKSNENEKGAKPINN